MPDRSRRSVAWALVASALALAPFGCGSRSGDLAEGPPRVLSAFNLFEGPPIEQRPASGVIPYDLNSALFSDYTTKHRFVKLPPGESAKYDAEEVFDFPVGTVIAKTFAYPRDARDPTQGQRLLETRILRRLPEGWDAHPYVWNEEQTEATLEVAGDTMDAEWIHTDGERRENRYAVPNVNQCKGCHDQNGKLQPLGPKARHLNRDYVYGSGQSQQVENQLAHWIAAGALRDAPAPEAAPRLAAWDDPHAGTLAARARAWLEINCAHCHQPGGPARNSGLDLRASQQSPVQYGIFKAPVAAGRGTGGRAYDIVPGRPDESILIFRMESSDPGIMMPELGKRLVHTEGLALVREWIESMPPSETTAGR